MPTSEEDLQAKRDKVDELREQLAAEQAKQRTAEQDASTDVVADALDLEAERLQREIALAQAAGDPNAVATTNQSAKQTMQAAAGEAGPPADAVVIPPPPPIVPPTTPAHAADDTASTDPKVS